MQRYEKYKDSGVDWIGEIPEGWNVLPGLSFIYENKEKNKGMLRNTVLSLSYGKIRVKAENELTGLVPESFETYQLVNVGDLIFRPTDLQNDMVSLRSSISEYEGIITSAYLNLRFKESANPNFFHYFFRSIDNNKIIYGLGSGLRQNISYLDFRRFLFPFPPLSEQTTIAKFLDDKTAKIDQLIGIKQKEIELLKERRQILIQQAVTGKIVWDASTNAWTKPVEVKDSGVDWIGEIPEHWEVTPGRTIFKERKESNKGLKNSIVLSLSYGKIIIKPEEKMYGLVPESFETYQLVYEGDIIVRGTDLQNDKTSLRTGLSHYNGIITSAYLNLIVKNSSAPSFIQLFLYVMDISKEIYKYGSGLRQNLSFNDFKLMPILDVPLDEQIQIVSYLEEIEEKIAKAILLKQQEIEKLKEYKTVLIDQVVTGKVKVMGNV